MITAADFDKRYDIVDEVTPRHTPMMGRYKKSFAYFTLRERLPVILTGIVDGLTRDKDEIAAKYGEASREEIKSIVGDLSKLKYQLQTDKMLQLFKGDEPDKDMWNEFLQANSGTFFKVCWLYAECYMYRKVHSFFEASEYLKEYDYFSKQKQRVLTCCIESLKEIARVSKHFSRKPEDFIKLIKLNLWGNRADLSISAGKDIKHAGNPFELCELYESNILTDESDRIWKCISEEPKDKNSPVLVDMILDNAGYELFTDFILADFIIEHKLASKVRFHVKALPWFISDVMKEDFHWTLQYLSEHQSRHLSDLGKKWLTYHNDGRFELMPPEYFWTSPYEFYRMRDINPQLYKKLSESQLAIFKGDLNYRKLLGDYTWDANEEFITCLRGFLPTNLCTLRTVKADLICGLRDGVAQALSKSKPNWMVTGDYGIIQFAEKDGCNCAL